MFICIYTNEKLTTYISPLPHFLLLHLFQLIFESTTRESHSVFRLYNWVHQKVGLQSTKLPRPNVFALVSGSNMFTTRVTVLCCVLVCGGEVYNVHHVCVHAKQIHYTEPTHIGLTRVGHVKLRENATESRSVTYIARPTQAPIHIYCVTCADRFSLSCWISEIEV